MLEQLLTAEAWKSVETACKIMAFSLAGFGALNGAIAFVANRNAALRAAEPRDVPAVQEKTHDNRSEPPFSILLVTHGSAEANIYADRLASSFPPGSKIERFGAQNAVGLPSSDGGLLYYPNGQDPNTLLLWLKRRSIKATYSSNIPVPGSIMGLYRGYIILVIGPKN